MKLKITIVIILINAFIINAQKQIQPYNFSVTEDGKTNMIVIHATAEAVNSITFTLKNAKNEILKDEDGKDIEFKVFPFTEVSFRNHLTDNISKINEPDSTNLEYSILKSNIEPLVTPKDSTKTKEESKKDPAVDKGDTESQDQEKIAQEKELKKLRDENNKLKSRKEAVYIIRNIYQFFNALVITAFQYDTEPVAGVLHYKFDTIIINKKTIQGLNTDLYFKNKAKFIRRYITKSEIKSLDEWKTDKEFKCQNVAEKEALAKCLSDFKTKYNLIKVDEKNYMDLTDYRDKETDSFLTHLRTFGNGRIIKEYYEFNQNSIRGRKSRARSKFKRHAIQKLKEQYNNYELIKINKIVIADYNESQGKRGDRETKLKTSKLLVKTVQDSLKTLKPSLDLLQKKSKQDSIVNLTKIKREIDSLDLIVKARYNEWQDKIKDHTNVKSEDVRSLLTDYYNEDKALKAMKELKDDKQRQFIEDHSNDAEIKKLKARIANNNAILKKEKDSIASYSKSIDSIETHLKNLIADNKTLIQQFPLWKLKATEIELDINDGFIEHMKVVGKIVEPHYNKDIDSSIRLFFEDERVKNVLNGIFDKTLKFENDFPFGFSSKSDFADLYTYYLFQSEGQEKTFSLPITNVITYIQRHRNDRLDFSPKDQEIRLPLNDPNKKRAIELKKEISSKILSVNTYTDFNGFQQDAENGLLQMEVNKKIPIWTKRMNLGFGRSSNFGFANYANFNLSWQKIGQDDRELVLFKSNRFENNVEVVDFYTTYLEMVKHENVSVGVDLNIASFDFPLVKTRLELNAGAHYGRIKVVDERATTSNQEPPPPTRTIEKITNMIRLYPDIMLWIRPEERFGGYIRFRPFRTIVPNNEEFFAVSSGQDFVDHRKLSKSWLHRYELSTFFTPSKNSDNKFFFRYRYTNDSTWETNGYSEVQIGLLAYLKF
ncbi:hypothetical protein VOI54_05475 [Tamlana sp. 2201CG12-4]|uniref:hypothetical protein n=1 Tax=Tamlana sp. 2201CG12-4 TaxID=3112582 RepID=UPI002DBA5A75|nr:hypothetical protein [Tamlana sp. 2201CG12-4]MEC3906457.1 hypothetical protein [Tamlana sp. 2201CG12-4]